MHVFLNYSMCTTAGVRAIIYWYTASVKNQNAKKGINIKKK